MKASIKRRKLPDAPPPTRAVCSRVVVGDISRHLSVVDVDDYKMKPAPILKKKKPAKQKKARRSKTSAMTYMFDRQAWTDERIDRLIELYNSGMTFDDIGFEMQCSGKCASTMICNLRAKGIVKTRRLVYGWTEKQNNDLIEAYQRGATYEEMARITGKSTSVCWYQVRRLLGPGNTDSRERGRKKK